MSSRTHITPATRAMSDQVVAFLCKAFDRHDDFFAKAIALHWDFGIDEIGYAMWSGNDMVGFFGLHHSRRVIRGEERVITGMHSVGVLPEFRGRGTSALVDAALGDTTRHYVAWTANPVMTKRYLKMGFQPQDTERCIVFPGTTLWTLPSGLALRRIDAAHFADIADARVTKTLADHEGGRMSVFRFQAMGKPLGLITRRAYAVGGRYPVSDLIYASDPELLKRCFEPVRLLVHRHDRSAGLRLNPAELGFRPRFARSEAGSTLFRSPELGAGDFNQLYGELIFLD